ncbi:hypothetical protein [Cellvibrio mixtus]|uniref:hypothetical protein n=1 Tax=Cellvibrio mixtus TaxID=39650 RepID=UPI000587A489|nr:hypothetical protein [Cellvibrio mixtus]
MGSDEDQFLNEASAYLEKSCDKDLRKLRRQLRAAEAFEKRNQQEWKADYLDELRHSLSKPEHRFSDNKNDYPNWAPQSLLNRLSILDGELGDNLGQSEYVKVLELLCTNDRMRTIWIWLGKNFQKSDSIPNFDVLAYRFSKCLFHAFHGMNSWNSLTQKQGEKKLDEIVCLIEKLSTVLDEFPVSECVLDEFNADELKVLRDRFLRHVLQDMRSKVPSYFLLKIEDHAESLSSDYGDLYFSRKNPSLGDLLKRVGRRLRSSNFNSITTNNSESGRLRYFIRVMAKFMEEHYGSRKDAQIAEIANVFFDTYDLDAKRVADLFRSKS